MNKKQLISKGLLCAVVSLLMAMSIPVSAQQNFSSRERNDSSMTRRTHYLHGVTVRGSVVNRVNRSAFDAVAIDTRRLRNTNLDIAHVLDRVSGVKLRQDGGVGSQASINLNGFTGKHVRLFINGMPMDEAMNSFSISNIPASLASRVEVYKGVVPVSLGGDALGGAINIVTDIAPSTYVDASYSYGSFNTHRSNIALGWTSKKGFMLRLNAYQNYSDNDYKVKTQWTDLTTNAVSEEEGWFRRFHDRYHNEAVMLQAGLVGKSWADHLIFGLQYSHERADIQNANLMKIVFGGKFRKNRAWAPSLMYDKYNLFTRGLHLRLSARYDDVLTNNVDTVSRTYSWTGQWRQNSYQGEGVATLAEFYGRTFTGVANLDYRIADHHFFTLNDTYTNYHRHTTNNAANAAQQTAATFMRRVNIKNILGLSYQFVPMDAWNMEVFGKHYDTRVQGPVNTATSSSRAVYEEQTQGSHVFGYGAATTWFLLRKDLHLKASYEHTYRLPTDLELFGDGDYEEGDAALKPESSNNINLNFIYQHHFGDDHTLQTELGLTYRGIDDYIIRTIGSKGTAVSTNHGKVRGYGMDFDARYEYKDVFTFGGNLSLQDLRDREHLNSIGAESVTYGDRVPNVPYAFSNMDASYTLKNVFGRGNRLTLGWDFRHVHRFYRTWAGYGAKLYIPSQTSMDANLTYVFGQGRYNIAFEANNFTNALLYDNYSLQKPGRNFSVKFRYVFYKRN